MPELPEVETVRRGLEAQVVGRTVSAAEVLHPRAVRRHVAGAEDLTRRLAGRRILAACRRGKYLWLPLGPGDAVPAPEALLLHLGMSGQLLIGGPPAAEGHLRVRLAFTDAGPALRFVDQRTFGGLVLDRLVDGVPSLVSHIARDPLDPEFDPEDLHRQLRRRRTEVKRALLDQSLVSGVGNIYADEALWQARLHPRRLCSGMSRAEARSLLGAVDRVLRAALSAGGTSFDALYVDINGQSGYFDRSLEAYGREGRACSRCGTVIARESFMNRSSYFCPACQRPPRRRPTRPKGP